MFTKTGKIALRLLIKLDARFKYKVICLFLFHLCEHSVDMRKLCGQDLWLYSGFLKNLERTLLAQFGKFIKMDCKLLT